MTGSSQLQRQLSKSKFVAGVQCLKRLYLQVRLPELAAEMDEGAEAILNQGHEVGLLAQQAFPGGVAVAQSHDELGAALDETQRLVADPKIPAIFEATFRYQGVLVRVDVLERVRRGRWRVIEVKSTTSVKDYHIYDVAIQRHVVTGWTARRDAVDALVRALLCDDILLRMPASVFRGQDETWAASLFLGLHQPFGATDGAETLAQRVVAFLGEVGRMGEKERQSYLEYAMNPKAEAVALVKGETKSRTSVFAGFNTPLLPEILITAGAGEYRAAGERRGRSGATANRSRGRNLAGQASRGPVGARKTETGTSPQIREQVGLKSITARPLRNFRFRANPAYELVLFDRLPEPQRQALQEVAGDPEGYGILRPREAGRLGVKSVSQDLALLFFTLQEPGPLPAYAQRSLGEQCDQTIAQLVLDGILEIEVAGTMLSGPAAHPHVCMGELAAQPEGAITALSRRALQYAQALEIPDAASVAARLYNYNRIPAGPRWRSLLPDRASVETFLKLRDGAGTAALERTWTRAGNAPDDPWIIWQANGSNSEAAHPAYKLYVSPAMVGLPEAFQASAAVAARSRAWSLKVGADVHGLLRPDKIVVYLRTFSDLQATAERLLRALAECPGHGVPFSAELAGGTLLSWGIDPPRDQYSLAWLARQSWRMWVTNRLATALVLARNSAAPAIEPWRFAMERVRLEGVDPRTWTPSEQM